MPWWIMRAHVPRRRPVMATSLTTFTAPSKGSGSSMLDTATILLLRATVVLGVAMLALIESASAPTARRQRSEAEEERRMELDGRGSALSRREVRVAIRCPGSGRVDHGTIGARHARHRGAGSIWRRDSSIHSTLTAIRGAVVATHCAAAMRRCMVVAG